MVQAKGLWMGKVDKPILGSHRDPNGEGTNHCLLQGRNGLVKQLATSGLLGSSRDGTTLRI